MVAPKTALVRPGQGQTTVATVEATDLDAQRHHLAALLRATEIVGDRENFEMEEEVARRLPHDHTMTEITCLIRLGTMRRRTATSRFAWTSLLALANPALARHEQTRGETTAEAAGVEEVGLDGSLRARRSVL